MLIIILLEKRNLKLLNRINILEKQVILIWKKNICLDSRIDNQDSKISTNFVLLISFSDY